MAKDRAARAILRPVVAAMHGGFFRLLNRFLLNPKSPNTIESRRKSIDPTPWSSSQHAWQRGDGIGSDARRDLCVCVWRLYRVPMSCRALPRSSERPVRRRNGTAGAAVGFYLGDSTRTGISPHAHPDPQPTPQAHHAAAAAANTIRRRRLAAARGGAAPSGPNNVQ